MRQKKLKSMAAVINSDAARSRLLPVAIVLGLLSPACGDKAANESNSTPGQEMPDGDGGEASPQRKAPPLSALSVGHGELDTAAPEEALSLASIKVAATVYKLPNDKARRLGYVRIGGKVKRDENPVRGRGCKKGEWYRVYPFGFMCTEDTTTDMDNAIVRASSVRPELDKPLPYRYGFVRATAPQYLRIPSKAEQIKSEFGLLDHIEWFHENKAEVQKVILGSNDIALDERGIAVPGLAHMSGYKSAQDLTRAQMFGSVSDDDHAPFWLKNGSRAIPNVAAFTVPQYAIFADRVRRHTGLSFVGSFNSTDDSFERRFGITVDLRLIPTTKVKPDTGSGFHGLEVPKGMHFPFAFVSKRDSSLYKLLKGRDVTRPAESAPHRGIVLLSGKARIKEGKRFYQTMANRERWLRDSDIGVVHHPKEWPEPALKGDKWVDLSIGQQTLTLYDGKVPRYATLVSTGKDRFGDPKKDLATPLGDFRLQSKHIAAAMDSEENSSVSGGKKSRKSSMDAEGRATVARLTKMNKAGQKMSALDKRRWTNVKKGRHPEYGVTRRRGSTAFELRDVPWIQYFSSGFALHGAYWHDVFGIPRSHGCVNLAPIDARLVFMWTDPPIPPGWHGVNVGEDMGKGTWIHIRR